MSVGIFRAFSGAEFVRFVIEIIEFAQNFALFGMFSVRNACASSAKHATKNLRWAQTTSIFQGCTRTRTRYTIHCKRVLRGEWHLK